MTKRDLLRLLQKLDLHPSRKLGQNFLIDPNTLSFIAKTAAPTADETILEIGPGTGVLTEKLLATGATIVAVEYDKRLAEYMQKRFANEERLTVIQGDAARLNLSSLCDGPFRCVSNLPYSVSTVVIGNLMSGDRRPIGMTLLLQREMGERLMAEPRTKPYGSLTVRTQVLYDVTIDRIIGPTVFHPQPNVDSALVSLELRDDAPDAETYAQVEALIKLGFSQRRKQVAKLLKAVVDRDIVEAGLESIGMPPTARAERLTPKNWCELAAYLQKHMV